MGNSGLKIKKQRWKRLVVQTGTKKCMHAKIATSAGGEKKHKSRPGRKCVRSLCVCILPDPHSSFDAFLFSLLLMLILLTLFLCPVCRDFAVLEDHTLAYNLQEQESK